MSSSDNREHDPEAAVEALIPAPRVERTNKGRRVRKGSAPAKVLKFRITVDAGAYPELYAVLKRVDGRVRSTRLAHMATLSIKFDVTRLLASAARVDMSGEGDGRDEQQSRIESSPAADEIAPPVRPAAGWQAALSTASKYQFQLE